LPAKGNLNLRANNNMLFLHEFDLCTDEVLFGVADISPSPAKIISRDHSKP
jgi:hypothetical protein